MNKALLIVDPQIDFINGSLAVPGAEKAMNALADCVAAKSEIYERIFITCDKHPVTHCSFVQNGGDWPAHCVQDTNGYEIWPVLKKALAGKNFEILNKGETPDKEEYSIFRNRQGRMRLQEFARMGETAHFDICGIAGDYCVLQTLADGVEMFGTDKFRILQAYVASLDDGSALRNFVKEKNICIK